MATYVIPSFPVTVSVFTGAIFGLPQRFATVGNLTPGKRTEIPQAVPFPAALGFMFLLLPPATDIRDAFQAGGQDGVEVPTGSGRQYVVMYVDDIGKGFPNEHRFAILQKTGAWPTPMP